MVLFNFFVIKFHRILKWSTGSFERGSSVSSRDIKYCAKIVCDASGSNLAEMSQDWKRFMIHLTKFAWALLRSSQQVSDRFKPFCRSTKTPGVKSVCSLASWQLVQIHATPMVVTAFPALVLTWHQILVVGAAGCEKC